MMDIINLFFILQEVYHYKFVSIYKNEHNADDTLNLSLYFEQITYHFHLEPEDMRNQNKFIRSINKSTGVRNIVGVNNE